MNEMTFTPYGPQYRDVVLTLTVAAWKPVFAKTREEVPGFVYDAFYPDGWEQRQIDDVGALLDSDPDGFLLATIGDSLVGFVGTRLHPEDRMGEILIVAVAPQFQRQGIGRALMDRAEQSIRESGMQMVMVETVGDSGHASARAAYVASGYQPWPVARYFKPL